MPKDKRSFFEKLTGTASPIEEDDIRETALSKKNGDWIEEESEDGELTVDVYHTPDEIVIKTIVAGVKPEDLDISITRDMVSIKGHREESKEVEDDDYFHRELYWGTFSRSIVLPEEIDVDGAEAIEKTGMLIIRLPKVDKKRQTKLKVRSN